MFMSRPFILVASPMITAAASYRSAVPAVAAVDAAGLIKGLVQGSTTLTVTYAGQTVTAGIEVTPPTVTGISLDAASYTMPAGLTRNAAVTATYSDGSTQNVTAAAVYQTTAPAPAIATVDAAGLIRGAAQGTTTLTAGFGGLTAEAQVVVNPADLVSIAFKAITYTMPAGLTQQTALIATYTDNSTVDLTAADSYQIEPVNTAAVNSAGLVTGLAPGTAVLTATYHGKTAITQIVVGQPILTGISLDSSAYTIREGDIHNTVVTGTYSDGSTRDLTAVSVFQSSAAQIAAVNASGLVLGVSAGNATLTVTCEGKTSTAQITVTARPRLSFLDGFESGDFMAGGWTTSGCNIYSGVKFAGTYSCRFNSSSDSLVKRLSTAGFDSIQVSYARMTSGRSSDVFLVEWYDGTQWHQLERLTGNNAWAVMTFNLPAGAANNANFRLRFRTANGSNRYAYLDEVKINGVGL